MKKKTEKIAKEILKKYEKTFKDLADYDKAVIEDNIARAKCQPFIDAVKRFNSDIL
jgi:hypothetical protein